MSCNACLEAVKRSLTKSLGDRLLAVDGDLTEQVSKWDDGAKGGGLVNGVCV